MIITIDGPAGTGKSTTARNLADAIGFIYFDTGALYRTMSWMILRKGISLRNEKALSKLLSSFLFRICMVDGDKKYFIGNQEVTKEIRSQEVTEIVSEVAALKQVRDALKPLQVNFAKKTDVIFEGRDLGTEIFPNAHLKFFLTARAEVRAQRRYRELVQKFPDQTFSYEAVLQEIQERDFFDSNRKYAPLKQADDAILIDTSDLTIKEVTDKLKRIYLREKK